MQVIQRELVQSTWVSEGNYKLLILIIQMISIHNLQFKMHLSVEYLFQC